MIVEIDIKKAGALNTPYNIIYTRGVPPFSLRSPTRRDEL